MPNPFKSYRAKKSQYLGKAGEERAMWFLKQIGAKCIEKIATPVKIVNGKAFYSDKSSVDFIAKIPSMHIVGTLYASRIEVKYRSGDILKYSDMEHHQIKCLTEWDSHDLGNFFYSFVLWIRHNMSCYLIPFPNDCLKHGKSITVNQANELSWYSWENK